MVPGPAMMLRSGRGSDQVKREPAASGALSTSSTNSPSAFGSALHATRNGWPAFMGSTDCVTIVATPPARTYVVRLTDVDG